MANNYTAIQLPFRKGETYDGSKAALGLRIHLLGFIMLGERKASSSCISKLIPGPPKAAR
jgi:hypothetical protein